MTRSLTVESAPPRESAPALRLRLVYIVSAPVPCVAYRWIAEGLDRERFDLSFLLPNLGPAPLEAMIRGTGVPVQHIPLDGRFGAARATRAVARYCRETAAEIVHVHMERACLPGLLGARLAGVPVRVHTRHIAGPYPTSYRPRLDTLKDRRNNWLSTHIVAPSETARRTLVERDGAAPAKITVIPHGFDLAAFGGATAADAARMRAKYGLGDDAPVIGVVSRFLAIKGIDDIITAFQRLLATHPRAQLVLANARGQQEREVRARLREVIPGRYTEVVYEEDMPALYRTFDAFVHVPIEPHYESFGQVYVESLASGVPSVFTLAGAAGDFVRDGENALVVPARSPDSIHEALLRLLNDPALRARLAANGRRDVEDRYDLPRMLRALEDLYLRLAPGRGVTPR
jgi:glycosyltransferase involved in cell wall biosynthesis